ncbi:hypothetical protein M9H77_07929 [Catharanthus roseus]|uniref:Uncharacterized protein n=1 Tax=Catharanthus roseus TaxID=4058 RepID=A0ACC0BWL3_CATRO|nr:hypothetical protein M9H77_07929 [Catharanthus roseus]
MSMRKKKKISLENPCTGTLMLERNHTMEFEEQGENVGKELSLCHEDSLISPFLNPSFYLIKLETLYKISKTLGHHRGLKKQGGKKTEPTGGSRFLPYLPSSPIDKGNIEETTTCDDNLPPAIPGSLVECLNYKIFDKSSSKEGDIGIMVDSICNQIGVSQKLGTNLVDDEEPRMNLA